MPGQAKSSNRDAQSIEPDDRAALLDEIARQKEEIQRLRDLLIARDAELGAAKGRLAELTEHSPRLRSAVRRLGGRRG
ncbi:MAG TPA: hypothetical protein VF176_00265 [Solirubrobacterales bacterium]